jgi:hypothetical protein
MPPPFLPALAKLDFLRLTTLPTDYDIHFYKLKKEKTLLIQIYLDPNYRVPRVFFRYIHTRDENLPIVSRMETIDPLEFRRVAGIISFHFDRGTEHPVARYVEQAFLDLARAEGSYTDVFDVSRDIEHDIIGDALDITRERYNAERGTRPGRVEHINDIVDRIIAALMEMGLAIEPSLINERLIVPVEEIMSKEIKERVIVELRADVERLTRHNQTLVGTLARAEQQLARTQQELRTLQMANTQPRRPNTNELNNFTNEAMGGRARSRSPVAQQGRLNVDVRGANAPPNRTYEGTRVERYQ